MASKPIKGRQLSLKLKRLFAGAKKSIIRLINNSLKSPLSWRSIFWDGYLVDEFPEHVMRVLRILIGLAYIIKSINITFLGLFLVIDGIYSVYRYRFEFKLTKTWHEDIPRLARSLLGFMLMKGVILS